MQEESKKDRLISGYNDIGFKRESMRIQALFHEEGTCKLVLLFSLCLVNFDVFEEILERSLIKNLQLQPKDTPLILTENSIHNKDNRTKLTKFLFEKFQFPAIFICKDAVLTAFACGRSTALVLDSGYRSTTATPVHDGYVLQKSIVRHAVGGESLSQLLANYLENTHKASVKPRFLFKRKFKVVDGQEVFETLPVQAGNVDPSYTKWCQGQILDDLKQQLFFVSEEPLNN